MPRALSVDLRARVVPTHAAGMPVPEIVHTFEVSRRSVSRGVTRITQGQRDSP